MFTETFLQAKNQDCLVQVLSFLDASDLGNVGSSSKTLHQIIFQETDANINSIWQGAETRINKKWDRQERFRRKARSTLFSSAREFCHLFSLASTAAARCVAGSSDDEADDTKIMMVDGVLGNLMSVRGYDNESIKEKLAIGAKETRTVEEAASEYTFGEALDPDNLPEDWIKQCKEQELRFKEKWQKIWELTEPDHILECLVFLRITRASTGELVSQGFCDCLQKLPWHAGLDFQSDFNAHKTQGLQVCLDFEAFHEMPEVKAFSEACKQWHTPESDRSSPFLHGPELNNDFKLTAVTIDKRNHDISCLFAHRAHERVGERLSRQCPTEGQLQGMDSHCFRLQPRWENDSLQMGPSISHDRYRLLYTFSFNSALLKNGDLIFLPSLDIDIQQDKSALHMAMMRRYQ